MAGSESIITITGNLGRDPEVKFTPDGVAVAEFSVAVQHRKRDGDTWVDDGEPDWYRVTAWRYDAEAAAEELVKGTPVRVTGTFRPRTYTTKSGEVRTTLEVTADRGGVTRQLRGAKPIGRPQKEEDPWST